MSSKQSTMEKVGWLAVPYLSLLFFLACAPLVNISFATVGVCTVLGCVNGVFGLIAGMLFLSHSLFEFPHHVARRRHRQCRDAFAALLPSLCQAESR
ncbi:hypothetical protein [Caballeronia sp. J97]|uniref:hypothetical protein n=1 Tax=Caballeronia sp. J97 TaxID=2805429 RepID=UPI002AB11749|nr:hypothetical protein [Caballeronia sp. J97]